MNKVLICGHRSFVASGIEKQLEANGIEYDVFSRGNEERQGNVVTGDVLKMAENIHLGTYETVVNFIIIKNRSIEENIAYIKSLVEFCIRAQVKHLIQISSISVYPADVDYVDENSPIEKDPEKKGGYGSVKVAVDQYLLSQKLPFEVTFVRPGFIVCDEKELSMAGIVMKLPVVGGILLGDAHTSLPLIEKKRIHEAIVRIIMADKKQKVYLLLENMNGTKAQFTARYYKGHVFKLPKKMTLIATNLLKAIGVFKPRYLEQVKGLFKHTYYDSSETEYQLQMSFAENAVAVLGAGTYGSYAINALESVSQKTNITLFDVGNESLKDEDEIGYGTNLLGALYTGLKKGRFFGYGGASGKWGGQLLMFTDNDFVHPSKFMQDIIDLDNKYRDHVFKKFGIKNPFEENHKEGGLFTKTGVWLGYFNRNLFNYFKIKKSSAFIRNGLRVSRILLNEDKKCVTGIELLTKDGKVKHAYYSQYFMTAGAFESNRIALSSCMCDGDTIPFSDHMSQQIFNVKGSTTIGGEDFQFGLQGTSMITKRLIGEVGDISFFANPIYNDEFPFFQNLKKIMFKGEFSPNVIWDILRDIPSVIAFVWDMVFLHKIYVYKNQWKIFIDIENPTGTSKISLSKDKDDWGLSKLDVDFFMPNEAMDVFNEAHKQVAAYLTANGVNFENASVVFHAEKAEDTYHPYGMFLSNCDSVDDYFNKYENMLIVNTGILPRAGGINTTASCFPLIEDYIVRKYGR
nr:NAD-dependent epimerase/dehydratase family protein [uncultured Bacteroides sp.]